MDAAQLVLPQRVAGRAPGVTSACYLGEVGASLRKEGSLQVTCEPAPQGHTAPCYPGFSAQRWSCLCPKVAGKGGRRPRDPGGCRGRPPHLPCCSPAHWGTLSFPRTFCQHCPADPPACGGPREGGLSCAGLEGCLGGVWARSELEPRLSARQVGTRCAGLGEGRAEGRQRFCGKRAKSAARHGGAA